MSDRISSGCSFSHQRQRLAMGAGDAGHMMAQALDEELQIGGRQRLVLDDQDAGRRDLVGDLAVRLLDQPGDAADVDVEDLGDLGRLEALPR